MTEILIVVEAGEVTDVVTDDSDIAVVVRDLDTFTCYEASVRLDEDDEIKEAWEEI